MLILTYKRQPYTYHYKRYKMVWRWRRGDDLHFNIKNQVCWMPPPRTTLIVIRIVVVYYPNANRDYDTHWLHVNNTIPSLISCWAVQSSNKISINCVFYCPFWWLQFCSHIRITHTLTGNLQSLQTFSSIQHTYKH